MKYKINNQSVSILLMPGESMLCQSGSVSKITSGIEHTQVLGETGRFSPFSWIPSLIRRYLLKESALLQQLKNVSDSEQEIEIASDRVGEIIPVRLGDVGGILYAQRGALLCMQGGAYMRLGLFLNPLWQLFGGDRGFSQKFIGHENAHVFIQAFGAVKPSVIKAGEKMTFRTGTYVASGKGSLSISLNSISNGLFGGQGWVQGAIKGPTVLYTQSMTYAEYLASMRTV